VPVPAPPPIAAEASPPPWLSPADRPVQLPNGRWLRYLDVEISARRRTTAGGFLLGFGLAAQAAAIAIGATVGERVASDCAYNSCGSLSSLVFLGVAGAGMTIAGIPLLASGAHMKQVLERYQPSLAFAPSGSGGAVAAGIRF
jgi:hypothetical protein